MPARGNFTGLQEHQDRECQEGLTRVLQGGDTQVLLGCMAVQKLGRSEPMHGLWLFELAAMGIEQGWDGGAEP